MTDQHVVVAGGAGFLGSHLCDALLARGDHVTCLDDLSTGRWTNVAHLATASQFRFIKHDVCQPVHVDGPIDAVMNLASPASPKDYLRLAVETLAVGSVGTRNLLDLAEHHSARFFLASTSEVYGDPTVHPQVEGYFGNVNPIGVRSVYDEAKRFAEAITMAYRRDRALDVRVVRIFNTYGPRMKADDGRVVSNFIRQALRGSPITIYGDGSQTRSFCYVDDEVRGFLALLDGDIPGPVNIGNPVEFTMLELATLVLNVTGSTSKLVYEPLPSDDPKQRCPDISLARRALGWEPTVALAEGVARTASWLNAHDLSTSVAI